MNATCAYSQQVTSRHLSLNRALSLCFYGFYVVKEKEKALFFGCNPSGKHVIPGVCSVDDVLSKYPIVNNLGRVQQALPVVGVLQSQFLALDRGSR